MAAPSTVEAKLAAIFSQTARGGAPLYSPEQIAHALPFILLVGADGVRGQQLPDVLMDLMGRLGHALGLRPGVTSEKLVPAATDYFRTYPVHPSLLGELTRAVDGNWGAAAQAVCALSSTRQFAAWLPAAATPKKPRVKGGPLARHALGKKR